MKYPRPSDYIEPYLDDAVRGHRREAVRLAIDLLDQGVREELVVTELLAAAQREVGERWYRNELTVADEHVATGVSSAALEALSNEARLPDGVGHTVVACAEGDWHALAAQMFGESLRGYAIGVTVLGASTPAAAVAELITRRGADSLAVSCSLPIFYPGVASLVDRAHAHGIPVIVGGRAFGGDARRAERLGADAWAPGAAEAAGILAGWRAIPPSISRDPVHLDPVAVHLADRAGELGRAGEEGLLARFPQMATYDERQLARTREDLVFIVQFLAAATLVADDSVFTDFLDWLQTLLVARGVRPQGLIAGLEALAPLIGAIDGRRTRHLDSGRERPVHRDG